MTKRLTVDLPNELHTNLKVLSAMLGKDMSDLVRQMIKDYLKKAKKFKGHFPLKP